MAGIWVQGKRVLWTCALAALSGVGSSWALSGKLLNNSGNALADAEVKLLVADVSDTTDSQGYFSIKDPTVGSAPSVRMQASSAFIAGGRVSFSLPQDGMAALSVYSIHGTLLGEQRQQFQAGQHTLSFGSSLNGRGSGVYLIVLQTGASVQSFRYFYAGAGAADHAQRLSSPNTSALRKTADSGKTVVDTLLISKTIGDVTSTRKLLVYGYTDSINDYISGGKQILILDPSNDNDGDGLTNYEERHVYFTNAELVDTDGDGISDYQEIQDSKNPLVADVPDFAFSMVSYPTLIAHYTTTSGETVDQTISNGGDYSKSSTFSTTQELNWKAEIAFMLGFQNEWKADGGFTLNGSVTTTLGVGGSVSFSQERSESMSENWENSKTNSRSMETTFENGEIRLDVQFVNNSKQTITLVDPVLRLTNNGYNVGSLETMIGELHLDGGNSVTISSATGSNTEKRLFTAEISNPDLFELISKNSNGLTAQLQNIRFETSLGATDTLMSNVYNRTALVNVDYGYYKSGKTLLKKYIVTRNRYNEFYTSQQDRYISSSIADLLTTAGLTTVYDSTDGKFGIRSVDGLANGDIARGSWALVTQARDQDDSITVYGTGADYHPAELDANQNSIIMIVYSADADSDGLPDRTESVLGTDYQLEDSDGDGLSDGEEVSGWKRAGDIVDTTWQTNPLRKDSDGDGIDDPDDADPLSAEVNPLDSVVTLNNVQLVPTQGSTWSQAITDDSSAQLNVSVNTVLRGPVTLKLGFDHAIYLAVITRNGGTKASDTVVINTPTNDASITYAASLPLVLGSNSIQIRMYSKNGTQLRTLNLTGIDRRLIQIDPTNTNLFRVSAPSADKIGIGAAIYVNVDSLKAKDPLINRVFLLRSDIYATPLVQSDKTQKLIAQDLGDIGSGDANLVVGSETLGKVSTTKNSYRVVSILQTGSSTITNSDASLKRENDFVYFPYTANVDGADGKNYYAAPTTGSGIYYANERTIVIDSAYALMVQRAQFSWLIDWQYLVQMHLSINGSDYSARNDAWQANGTGTPKVVRLTIGKEMGGNDSIQPLLYNGEGWYRGNRSGTWDNFGSIPDPIKYQQIVHPATHPITDDNWTFANPATVVNPGGAFDFGTNQNWAYGSYTAGSVSDTLWSGAVTLGNLTHAFDKAFQIYWHYKYNDPKEQGN